MKNSFLKYVFRNWKTTVAGVMAVVVYVTKGFGLELTPETVNAVSTILLALGAFFAGDAKEDAPAEGEGK